MTRLLHCCSVFLLSIRGINSSVIAIRISQPDFSTSSVDSIILTVTTSPEYPHEVPAVSVSSELLHRCDETQLSTSLAEEAKQFVGQPLILDKCYFFDHICLSSIVSELSFCSHLLLKWKRH